VRRNRVRRRNLHQSPPPPPIHRRRRPSAASDALAATFPLGLIAYEPTIDDKDERFIWLGPNIVNRLRAAGRISGELEGQEIKEAAVLPRFFECKKAAA
jgi:hypothetical protein